MLCQNCGKNEVTFRYTQVINGVKKEMNLCDKCARQLGLKDMNFSMPISFSSFLGDFFNEYNNNLLPSFMTSQNLKCKTCNTTFDDFLNSGEFGCADCYNIFEDRIFSLLKNLQGANKHIGRGYRKVNPTLSATVSKGIDLGEKIESGKKIVKENSKETKIEKLQKNLQKAIKDERYEDAAKIRDEIKKIENESTKNNENDDNIK